MLCPLRVVIVCKVSQAHISLPLCVSSYVPHILCYAQKMWGSSEETHSNSISSYSVAGIMYLLGTKHENIINLCHIRVVIVYLAGVVFGSVGGSLPSPTSYLAGASAGVYALIAAHVSTLVMNWKVGTVFFAQGILMSLSFVRIKFVHSAL